MNTNGNDQMHDGLARRLSIAREQAELSTRAVAARLSAAGHKVSHQTISNYEKGIGVPPITLVASFASLVGRDINWFLQRGAVWTGINYRMHKSKVTPATRSTFEQRAQRWVEAYLRIEQLANRPLEPRMQPESAWEKKKPGAAALALREAMALGERAAVPSVPRLLEEFGIRVLEMDTPDGVDGMAGRLDNIPVVILSRTSAADRFRLSGCHELWHHLLGHCVGEMTKEKEDTAFSCGVYTLIPESVLADAFAGKSMVKLLTYKESYGVSLAAMIYRGEKQGLISAQEARYLWIEFSKRGWREKEPGTVRPDRALRFEELVDEVRTTKGLELVAIAEVIGVGAHELEERMKLALTSDVNFRWSTTNGGAAGPLRQGQMRLTT